MKLTVKEALKLDVFKSASLLAGEKGLGRYIEKVTILDSPDISSWVSGNELIVTNAYVLKAEAASQEQIINGLIDKGCSAMAIKLGRYINTIPQHIIDLANEKSFPIISLSFEATWTDIINEVLTKILNLKYHLLQQSKDVSDIYMREIFYESGYKGICTNLAQALDATVIICDSYGNHLCSTIRQGDQVYPNAIKEASVKYRTKEVNLFDSAENAAIIFSPVVVRHELLGFLYLKRPPGELSYIQRSNIDHALMTVALQMLKQKTSDITKNRVKIQLINEVIFNKHKDLESIKALALSYGWDITLSSAAVIFKSASEDIKKNEDLFNHANRYIDNHEGLFLVNRYNDVLMFIACSDINKVVVLAKVKSISGYLQKNFAGFKEYKVGIGQICCYQDFAVSYNQARDAIGIGQAISPEKMIYDIDDLIIYRILWNYSGATELERFVEATIGALINEDDDTSKLINTLEKFLAYKNIRQTAEQLYIHNNTAVYRLNRIKAILNVDLEDPEISYKLTNAIKIYKHGLRGK